MVMAKRKRRQSHRRPASYTDVVRICLQVLSQVNVILWDWLNNNHSGPRRLRRGEGYQNGHVRYRTLRGDHPAGRRSRASPFR